MMGLLFALVTLVGLAVTAIFISPGLIPLPLLQHCRCYLRKRDGLGAVAVALVAESIDWLPFGSRSATLLLPLDSNLDACSEGVDALFRALVEPMLAAVLG
jgi:hypothetical protein